MGSTCAATIYRDEVVTVGKTYTFSVEIDRSNVAGFEIRLYTAPSIGGTGTVIPGATFLAAANGFYTFTYTPVTGQTIFRYEFKKTTNEVTTFKLDNLRLNRVNTRYLTVVKKDNLLLQKWTN